MFHQPPRKPGKEDTKYMPWFTDIPWSAPSCFTELNVFVATKDRSRQTLVKLVSPLSGADTQQSIQLYYWSHRQRIFAWFLLLYSQWRIDFQPPKQEPLASQRLLCPSPTWELLMLQGHWFYSVLVRRETKPCRQAQANWNSRLFSAAESSKTALFLVP